jgi:hypothetical protein
LIDADGADLVVYGVHDYDHLGRSVASCDVSGDGVDDLIMGAYTADHGSELEAGAVYVVFGSSYLTGTLTGTIELDSAPGADFTILGDDGNSGRVFGDRLGRSVACKDVNGDGTADIIAGAQYADQTWGDYAGEVYVVFGGAILSGTLNLNDTDADLHLRGAAEGDEAGFYVAGGDINGDGLGDILVGAYMADATWGTSESGTAYVVYGNSTLSGTLNLSDTADITIYPAGVGDHLGRSLGSGDINGDGYDDILVSASTADPPGRIDAGITYVIYGAREITPTIYLSDTDLIAVQVLGTNNYHKIGQNSTRSGDLNSDGVDDLIIGAINGGANSNGEVYLVHGSKAMTLTLSPTSAVITAGHSITYTATACNKFGDWDNTTDVTFTISAEGGGSWSDNVYSSAYTGSWVVTGTFHTLIATATIEVVGGAAPTWTLYLPIVTN